MKLAVRCELGTIGELSEFEDQMRFSYALSWLDREEAFALSFSLPLQKDVFSTYLTRSFFENILAEEKIRIALGKKNKIDAEDEFTYLKEFGEDCAGAIQILRPEDAFKKPQVKRRSLGLDEINRYLDRREALYVAMEKKDGYRFSLAGAQDKLPVIYDNGLYLPVDGQPSTHILKPPIEADGLKETSENEYFCMRLAKLCGLNVPEVDLLPGRYPLFLIERYDRTKGGPGVQRLHQQDFCQALGLTSKRKYETRGGPTFAELFLLVKERSEAKTRDLGQILDWLCFNILIGNNDSHAKNLSFLLRGGRWSMAPYYDILSTAVYPDINSRFAFSIGGQDRVHLLRKKNFELLEQELGVARGALQKRLIKMGERIEENFIQASGGLERFFIMGKIERLVQARLNNFSQKVF